MDHLFQELEPPKRDNYAKQETLKKIKQRAAKKPKWNWQYYGAIVVSLAIIFVLFATLPSDAPSQRQTTTANASIKNIFMFEQTDLHDTPRTHMSKWYYTDKSTLSLNERQQVEYLFKNRTPIEGEFDTTLNLFYTAFLVQYDDGTMHFYQFDRDKRALYNFTTHEMIALSEEENAHLIELYYESQNSLPAVIRIFILIGLYVIYQQILFKLSPIRKEKADNPTKGNMKPFLLGVGLIAIMFFVVGLSGYLYDAHNILFIFALITLFFLLRKISYWYNGKHYYPWIEVPLGAIFYTAFVYVFYL